MAVLLPHQRHMGEDDTMQISIVETRIIIYVLTLLPGGRS
jgi:hypothetical protein